MKWSQMSVHSSTFANERGSVLTVALSMVGLVGIVGAIVIGSSSSWYSNVLLEASDYRVGYAIQRASSLGGYLVAQNLVACREQGWSDLGGKRCRWGGGLRANAAATPPIPPVDMSEFQLTRSRYERLSQDLPDEALTFDQEIQEGGVRFPVKLQFDLVNWSTETKVRALTGFIPRENSIQDDDVYAVLIKVSIPVVDSETNVTRMFTHQAQIRRPIPGPIIDAVRDGLCQSNCIMGEAENPHGECRGPLEMRSGATVPIRLTIRNVGPGALYRLKLEQLIIWDRNVFPDRNNPADIRRAVDAMAGSEVLMPGAPPITLTDQMPCYAPDVQVAANAATNVSTLSSMRSYQLNTYRYWVSPSRFDPTEPLRNPNFFHTYNPFDPSTYSANPSTSEIEPKKLGPYGAFSPNLNIVNQPNSAVPSDPFPVIQVVLPPTPTPTTPTGTPDDTSLILLNSGGGDGGGGDGH